MKFLSTRLLFILFISFRLMILILYRPGGLLEVGDPYVALPILGLGSPLLRQTAVGLFLLLFDIGSLWLLYQLLLHDKTETEARWRVILWAVSPLPLWVWLTSGAPLLTFLLLGAYWGMNLRQRSWLWAALPLALATLVGGPTAELTSLLLPFILLLLPSPALYSITFTLAALLAGPVSELLGVTALAATLLQVGYILTLMPILSELVWMLRPMEGWRRWRFPIFMISSGMSLALFAIALFVFVPRELRPQQLAASSLAPALHEMQAAPSGWFITDNHDLWQEAVSLGVGSLTAYVASERNWQSLRSELQADSTSVWVLESNTPDTQAIYEPLLADFFVADRQALEDGTHLQRFVSKLDQPVTALNAIFTDGVALLGVRLPNTIPAGSVLGVELQWQDEVRQEKLFLHLIAPDGSLATQRDTLPAKTPDRHALLIPSTLTAGSYTLFAGRYNPENGQRVELVGGGNTVTLGQVEITK